MHRIVNTMIPCFALQESSAGGTVPLCIPRDQFNAWLAYLTASELDAPNLMPPQRLVSVLLVRSTGYFKQQSVCLAV